MKVCEFTENEFIGHISDLYILTENWEKEANLQDFGFILSHNEFVSGIINFYFNKDTGIIFLINGEDENSIIGFMGLQKVKSPTNYEFIANEHYLYILPQYRGKYLLKMINKAEEWAKKNDCKYFMINASLIASDKHDKICKLCEHLKMKKLETVYIKKLEV